MIWLVQALSAGNALRVLIAPPSGAARWRLLRKDADTFSGPQDAEALVVHDGREVAITDVAGLLNNQTVYYCLYAEVNGAWIASETRSGTPTATMADLGPDVLSLLRDRLEAGFKVYVDRGEIRHDSGYVPVMKASPQVENVTLPLVTVHLQNQATEVRGIGEMLVSDEFDDVSGEWESVEGGLDRVTVTIAIWSINSDLRIIMRKALRSILQSNLSIFAAAGIETPSWSMQDLEDYQTYEVPMFQTICTFDCLAPAAVQSTTPPIADALALPSVIVKP